MWSSLLQFVGLLLQAVGLLLQVVGVIVCYFALQFLDFGFQVFVFLYFALQEAHRDFCFCF
ncbi:MAG: hypothetical protein ACI9MF_001334, partial [Gammaproteobacteria bacterium]